MGARNRVGERTGESFTSVCTRKWSGAVMRDRGEVREERCEESRLSSSFDRLSLSPPDRKIHVPIRTGRRSAKNSSGSGAFQCARSSGPSLAENRVIGSEGRISRQIQRRPLRSLPPQEASVGRPVARDDGIASTGGTRSSPGVDRHSSTATVPRVDEEETVRS